MDVNRVMVMGRVGAAPKALKTKGGVALARFDVATSRRFRKEGAEGFSEETVWHRVVVWGRQGEVCHEYVTKGQRVFIEGELRTRSYAGPDGAARTVVEIHAHQVGFLERPREKSRPEGASPSEGVLPLEVEMSHEPDSGDLVH